LFQVLPVLILELRGNVSWTMGRLSLISAQQSVQPESLPLQ